MNCNSDTSISEFLAGISLLSVVIHGGIMYLMRPRIVNIRFDPTWDLTYMSKRSESPPVINTESDSENNEEDNKKMNDGNDGTFYSYFT